MAVSWEKGAAINLFEFPPSTPISGSMSPVPRNKWPARIVLQDQEDAFVMPRADVGPYLDRMRALQGLFQGLWSTSNESHYAHYASSFVPVSQHWHSELVFPGLKVVHRHTSQTPA